MALPIIIAAAAAAFFAGLGLAMVYFELKEVGSNAWVLLDRFAETAGYDLDPDSDAGGAGPLAGIGGALAIGALIIGAAIIAGRR